jgi:hypothetical protein
MSDIKSFNESPPIFGSLERSSWQEVPGCVVPFPWASELQSQGTSNFESYAQGWISAPGQDLVDDIELTTYRERFGWKVEDRRGEELGVEILRKTAHKLIDYARQHTFKSFGNVVLGVTIESSFTWWQGDKYEVSDDIDAQPHLDWTVQQPCLLALGASVQPSVLLNGSYIYRGDLLDGNQVIEYSPDDCELPCMPAKEGRLYIADSRRGLHSRPVMTPGFTPFPRLFTRAFIAARD